MSARLHDSWYAKPSPATVADIIDGYGWQAALERWPDSTYPQLMALYKSVRHRAPRWSAASGRGQPARALGGIDPAELFSPSEAWLSPGECRRECGDGARVGAWL